MSPSPDHRHLGALLTEHQAVLREVLRISTPKIDRMIAAGSLGSDPVDAVAADLEAIGTVLIKLSQLVIDCPEVAELDINPLLADALGVETIPAPIQAAVNAALERARLRAAAQCRRPSADRRRSRQRLPGRGSYSVFHGMIAEWGVESR